MNQEERIIELLEEIKQSVDLTDSRTANIEKMLKNSLKTGNSDNERGDDERVTFDLERTG